MKLGFLTPWLSMVWLLACCSHHTLRTMAFSPDGGAAPEPVDAEGPALETAAPSVDSASDGGVIDPPSCISAMATS
jgi:hypothetical protein